MKGEEMKNCPSCESENPDESKFCGKCGKELEAVTKKHSNWLILALAVIAIGVVAVLVWVGKGNKAELTVYMGCNKNDVAKYEKYYRTKEKEINEIVKDAQEGGSPQEIINRAIALGYEVDDYETLPCAENAQKHFLAYAVSPGLSLIAAAEGDYEAAKSRIEAGKLAYDFWELEMKRLKEKTE